MWWELRALLSPPRRAGQLVGRNAFELCLKWGRSCMWWELRVLSAPLRLFGGNCCVLTQMSYYSDDSWLFWVVSEMCTSYMWGERLLILISPPRLPADSWWFVTHLSHDSFESWFIWVVPEMSQVTYVMRKALNLHLTAASTRRQQVGSDSPESCPKWVMSHVWMSCVKYMDGLCHVYELVISQIEWVAPPLLVPCHMYDESYHRQNVPSTLATIGGGAWLNWVMSHVTYKNAPCHIHNESCHQQNAPLALATIGGGRQNRVGPAPAWMI